MALIPLKKPHFAFLFCIRIVLMAMPKSAHKIRVVDRAYLRERHTDFEKAMREAFAKSKFSHESYSVEDAIGTSIGKNAMEGNDIRNVIATEKGDKILGAVFRVPVQKTGAIDHTSFGWFFTSPGIGPRERITVADSIINEASGLLKKAGYRNILTTMGTEEGERYLQKRHGFRHVGADSQGRKLWVKELS
jgi:hypothetical protein